MLSGAKLIDYRKRYSTREFFKNRITKIGIPFLFWSVMAIVLKTYTGQLSSLTGREICRLLLTNGCVYGGAYWFLYTLFGLYLSFPVLGAIEEEKRKEIYGYMVIISLVCFSIMPFVMNNYLHEWTNNVPIEFAASSQYLMFAIWGYWITNFKLHRKTRLLFYFLGIISLVLLSVVTINNSNSMGAFDTRYCGWAGVPSFVLATAVYILARYCHVGLSQRVKWSFGYISKMAFGIYLIHPFVLQLLENFWGGGAGSLEFLWQYGGVLGLIVVFSISFIVVLVLKHLPGFKYIVT